MSKPSSTTSNIRQAGFVEHSARPHATARSDSYVSFFKFHGLWAPGVRAFRRMNFRAKATCISLAFLVPIVLLTWNFFTVKSQVVRDTRRELDGVVFARALLPVIKDGRQLRRYLMNEAVSSSAPPELETLRTTLSHDLASVQQLDAQLGDALGTHQLVAALEPALRGGAQSTEGLFKVFVTYGKFNMALINVLAKATDASGLTLDPDLDTYYLMDASLTALPRLLEQSGRLRVLSSSVNRSGLATDLASRELLRQDGLIEYLAEQLQADLAKVAEAHPEMNQVLDPGEGLKAIGDLRMEGGIEPDDKPDAAKAASVDKLGAAVVTRLEEVQKHALDALQQLLEARIASAQHQMIVVGVLLGLFVTIAAYLFSSFYLVMNGGLNEVKRHLSAMTNGDLSTSPNPWGEDEAASLMISLRDMQNSLRHIVTRVRRSSNSIVTASGEIAMASQDLSARTESTASNLEESASSMEQISSTVKQTADHVSEAAQVASNNSQAATRGGSVIDAVVHTMREINSSSKQISEIIGTIDGIAFQTNILALNAAVEAARAGEQGRGFAVVANEVRSLAQRSSQAAKEIKTLITTSVERVDSGTRVVQGAGETMQELVANAGYINKLLAEISTAASEQSCGITQVGCAVNELDRMTQQNAALVEQTSAAAAALKSQAIDLAKEVSNFKLPLEDERHVA